jgi:hypothetical protein
MMLPEPFLLSEVLAVAKLHPFYAPDVQFPPTAKDVQSARERANSGTLASVSSRNLLYKKDLSAIHLYNPFWFISS